MKKLNLAIVIMLVLITMKHSYGQNNKLSIDLNVPVLFGDNFIAEHYKGIINVGVKRSVFSISKVNVGVSGNLGIINKTFLNVFILKPRISAEIKLWKITPYVGVGYSLFYFFSTKSLPRVADYKETTYGFNINPGLKYHFFSDFYFNLSYDFVKLESPTNALDVDYNQGRRIKINWY